MLTQTIELQIFLIKLKDIFTCLFVIQYCSYLNFTYVIVHKS
jgi:hypothetical protein